MPVPGEDGKGVQNTMPTRILVADDEDTLRRVVSEVLSDDGHQVTAVGSGEEALEAFRESPANIVITDIVMKKLSGLDLLKEIKLLDPDAIVILMTSHASIETATSALRSGAYDFLIKPFEDLEVISAVVNRAVDKVRLLSDNKSLMQDLKRNAEELENLNRDLREMAIHDGLTGLHNYRFFRDALEVEVARAKRHDRIFSVIYMDVDNFKQYNDTHGHPAGDELLKTLAQILRKRSRASSICARYGGEEFVVLLPETDKDGALQYAEVIRRTVAEHPFPGRETQPLGFVSLSLGVAAFPTDGDDTKALLGHADRALYRAKNEGRNRLFG